MWSLEPQDCQESLDKTSLTPSEGTEEPGSPARSTRPHSLSPGSRNYWGQVEQEAAEDHNATSNTDREGDQDPLRMYCKNSDSQNALEDLAHYKFLAQLRKASTSASVLDHLNHNGTAGVYHPSSRHDELPPAIWSPGAQHHSPEGTDGGRTQQACPFCHRMFQRGASLRDHIKYCQDREGVHMACPLCGYTATHRAQMERHLALHNQVQDKSAMCLDQAMETRKFKCLQCGKAFKYKHHLKEHLRIHSGEKPYECSNCKKRFSHSGSYSSHLSSKKCLNGGGNTGGTSGAFNGHSQSSFHHSFPTSPPAGGGRNSNDKGSPMASQTQDNNRTLGRVLKDPHQLSLQDPIHNHTGFPGAADLARLWEPSAELSLRASILKGTTLLPYLHSGTKFEQMLQEMLHREVRKEEEVEKGIEERRVIYNGAGLDSKVSPERRRESGEGERGVLGVTCRWCSQLFPNVAVLLQHERYLCKMNREGLEVPEGLHSKDLSSPPLFYPRPPLQSENSKQSETTNGLSGNKSPLQKPSWHSVPQQLLVAMHSPPQPLHDARTLWSSQEKGSPSQPINRSPELSSPRARRRIPSSGFGSPVCLDLTSCPPELSSPQHLLSAQNEPLDLSLPKQLSDQDGVNKTVNGNWSRGEKRELSSQQLRRLSPTSHLPLHHHHAVFSGSGPPVFPSALYNGFPIFQQSGLGLSGHDGITAVPFSQPANGPGFLSPMAYMMEAEAEAALKKIHQERQVLMGEALSRGALDYLALMDDSLDGEGGPGRKRLKKTDEGLYACDICDKTFQKSSSLLRHKYEHTGKRPHECKICNKAFKHKHHLIEHSRLHSGEKPYQCDKCGKRFSHSGSYSQHMNHRYAYCSKDQDPDQDQEEMPLTPGAGNGLGGRLSDEPLLSMEDTQTPHSFLSDSSLDGVVEEIKEEEEDKETGVGDGRVEGESLKSSGAAEELERSPIRESPVRVNGAQKEEIIYDVGNNTENTERKLWDRDSGDQNGNLEKCELSLDLTDLPRIKT
ncbi:zinc finger E-box-binding homeobox 2-like isoform X3 [Cheilinus undulatus]|nr:zinc finger E-box-binding homeobox 2-like isoform X3 [Cheilinus undulatus]XP_041672569.1 zinc finger E-box-binding homeobox 2-like isoform X3 [Cheilinus undulatus]XP_041672578.1 zinc finger E-box-binding homeobox 2-like isoform X3 [Cheilinus undulatus]XP_041672587.1 zinc finger E-box-binding homeobox 2-like isoform X3 [Cheilinus undulatus]